MKKNIKNNTIASFDSLNNVMAEKKENLICNTPNLTIEAWVNLNTNLHINQRIITLNPNGLLLLFLNTNGKLEVIVNSDIEGIITEHVSSVNQLPNHEWTHIVVTLSINEIKLYINGKLDVSKSASTCLGFDEKVHQLQLIIGSTGETPEGMIDELKVYNVTLSLSDIQRSYNAISFGIITALSDLSFFNEVNVYPNPLKQECNIEYLSKNNEDVLLMLTSADGEMVYSKSISVDIGRNTIYVDLRQMNLTKGIYFVYIQSDYKVFTRKVVVE